jgi:biotin carboxylase
VVHVVFVCPFFSPNMLQCLTALASLDNVRLGVISHEGEDRIPHALRGRLDGHYAIANSLDERLLIEAGRAFQKSWGRVDRLIGFLEQMQLPLAIARDALQIPGMGEETARNFRDKNRMKEVLRQADLPVARQALITSAADARRFVQEVGFPIILKPIAGLGSRGTMRCNDDGELSAALNQHLPSTANPSQAEEFVRGEEHTFETVSIDGEPVWSSSSYYLPGPLEVIENPWVQYCVLLPREHLQPHQEAFRPTNAAALRALGMGTGLSHMEWFLRADGTPVISEVGARPPGVNLMPMMGRAHGVDMWAKWAALMVHNTFDMPPRQQSVGCCFFRGQGHGRQVRAVTGVERAHAKVGQWVIDHKLPVVGQPRADGYEGEGWAIVAAPDTQTVVAALRELVSTVRVDLG